MECVESVGYASTLQLEALGADGRVDEARDVMAALERLEKERDTERRSLLCWGPKVCVCMPL